MDLPVRYFLLRDDLDWIGDTAGLSESPDGTLALTRVPAPEAGAAILLDGPFDPEPSGIVAYSDDQIVIADSDSGSLVFDQRRCHQRFTTSIGGKPTSLAIAGDVLYVADAARARVQSFILPSLELRREIVAGFSRPTAVAVDSLGRLYVLDRGLARVVRFHSDGTVDAAYAPKIAQPQFMALDADDLLYVSDSKGEVVHVSGKDGAVLGSVILSPQSPAAQPRALAAHGNLLLVADAATGTIIACDRKNRARIGVLPNVQMPVAAMAFDGEGNLYSKHDGSGRYSRLLGDGGCVSTGSIVAGPLDAGELNGWARVAVTVRDNVDGAEVYTRTRSVEAAPSAPDWHLSPSLDCLLARERGPDNQPAETRRQLWLRIVLKSTDGITSPRLDQVRAQTSGASYFEQLPRIFRRDDQKDGFLERWLALFQSAFEERTEAIDFAGQAFDPQMAPADRLDWLCDALAFELPESLTASQSRALLAQVARLYAHRGTLEGVGEMAAIYAGIRPRIVEAFHARRVWQLGTASLLGFDTALAASTPEGMVVARDSRTDLAYAGLRGDYYRGSDFNALIRSRTDAAVDFADLFVLDDDGKRAPGFTVRWSGQIKPRYSETYLLQMAHGAGVRLWIDGQLLIDSWVDGNASSEARTVLDADRWHALQLEIQSLTATTLARFSWSSRRQQEEVVPQICLYSVLDEHADLAPPARVTFDVGHAVVGESGPQPESAFGEGLFTDYAHLFTVLAPAGSCRDQQHRALLREVIDAEKPAHTDYHLCFVEPRMRVGFQARLGIDAIVAGGPPPLRLNETQLGRDSYLDEPAPGGARVTAHAQLGRNTVVG